MCFQQNIEKYFNNSDKIPILSLPVGSAAVKCFLKFLVEGFVISNNKEDLMGAATAAKVLDIEIKDLQLGSKQGKKGENGNDGGKDKDVEFMNIPGKSSLTSEDTVGDDEISEDPDFLSENDISIQIMADKTFTCDECNKHFPDMKYLTIHKHTKHAEQLDKEVYCNECKATFLTGEELKCHMELHTCKICKRIFQKPAQVGIHIKVHKQNLTSHCDKSQYKCDICGKIFDQMKHLKSHTISHSEVRLFCCENCAKTFKRKSDLKKHTRKNCTESLPAC